MSGPGHRGGGSGGADGGAGAVRVAARAGVASGGFATAGAYAGGKGGLITTLFATPSAMAMTATCAGVMDLSLGRAEPLWAVGWGERRRPARALTTGLGLTATAMFLGSGISLFATGGGIVPAAFAGVGTGLAAATWIVGTHRVRQIRRTVRRVPPVRMRVSPMWTTDSVGAVVSGRF